MRGLKLILLGIVFLLLNLADSLFVEAKEGLRSVTSFAHDASIIKAIGGDKVTVNSLSRGIQDPHYVQPKPTYAALLNRADLLAVNGQLLEVAWLPTALSSCRNVKILEGHEGYLKLSEGVDTIPYAPEDLYDTPFFHLNLVVGVGENRIGNHHYYIDPGNGLIIAQNVYRKLAEMDPSNEPYYKANYEAFISKLKEKMVGWDAAMEPYKGVQLVTYHRTFNYLARRHGFIIFGYIEPRETVPPSAAYMASLVQRMKSNNVKLILVEHYQNKKLAQEVANQSGAILVTLATSVDEELGISDYIQMLDKIYEELTKALKVLNKS
jgi:zinc/manganese transport system substrate-binding protein